MILFFQSLCRCSHRMTPSLHSPHLWTSNSERIRSSASSTSSAGLGSAPELLPATAASRRDVVALPVYVVELKIAVLGDHDRLPSKVKPAPQGAIQEQRGSVKRLYWRSPEWIESTPACFSGTGRLTLDVFIPEPNLEPSTLTLITQRH
jgi:hypothetical protein